MIESQNLSPVKRGSERNLGVVFFFVFLFFGIISSLNENYNYLLFLISFVFLILAVFKPQWLKFLNVFWFYVGIKLGGLVAPIVMLAVYIIGIMPVSIILFLLRIDLLKLKKSENYNTYWINRDEKMQPMKNQF